MTLATSTPTAETSRGTSLPWLAPIAWGAGLVIAAMGASAIIADGSGVPDRALGLGLLTLGVLSLVWGALSLAHGRIVTPRIALGAIVVALISIGALLPSSGGRASLIAAAIAVALLVVSAALIGAARRYGASSGPAAAAGSVRILPLLISAALVAIVVTPALGAVQDAALLRSDGTVVVVDPHQGH